MILEIDILKKYTLNNIDSLRMYTLREDRIIKVKFLILFNDIINYKKDYEWWHSINEKDYEY